MRYRTCTKCGDKFPATSQFFYKNKGGKFGLYAECKVCSRKHTQEYVKNNKEKCAAVVKEYYKNNKEKVAAKDARWVQNNPEKVNAASARRCTLKLKQTPCLTETENQQMRYIHKKRQELGSNWHVDHIIPLAKEGWHHPDNLQIVRKKYNLEKGIKLNFRLPNKEEIFNWHEGFSLMNTDIKEKLEHEIQ